MAKKVDEYSQGSGGSQRWKSLELDFPVRPQTSPLPLSALHPLEAQPQLSFSPLLFRSAKAELLLQIP